MHRHASTRRSLARLGSGLTARARRRLHRIDPPPDTIYDSLGVRR